MVARYCPKCPAILLPSDFYRCSAHGFQRQCKECAKAARRESYAANPAPSIAKARAWQLAHPERRKQINRETQRRRWADPERGATLREYHREWKRRRLGITPDRYRVDPALARHEPHVPVAPVLAAVDDGGLTTGEIERLAGLGAETVRKARGNSTMRTSTAVAILNALGLDPVDVDL